MQIEWDAWLMICRKSLMRLKPTASTIVLSFAWLPMSSLCFSSWSCYSPVTTSTQHDSILWPYFSWISFWQSFLNMQLYEKALELFEDDQLTSVSTFSHFASHALTTQRSLVCNTLFSSGPRLFYIGICWEQQQLQLLIHFFMAW